MSYNFSICYRFPIDSSGCPGKPSECLLSKRQPEKVVQFFDSPKIEMCRQNWWFYHLCFRNCDFGSWRLRLLLELTEDRGLKKSEFTQLKDHSKPKFAISRPKNKDFRNKLGHFLYCFLRDSGVYPNQFGGWFHPLFVNHVKSS